MCDHQRIVFFPPGQIAAFAAEETHHLQQVVDLGRSESGLKRRHDPAPVGDEFPNLVVALSLHSIPEVRRLHWQVGSRRTVAPAAGAMTTIATLRIERVHPFIAPASGTKERQNDGSS